MKRLLFIIIFLCINNFLLAQNEKFTFGIGTGLEVYTGKIDDISIGGVGISLNINFYYNHTSHWSFGFERNGSMSMQFLARKHEDDYLVYLPFDAIVLSNVVDYTLKAKYYIGKSKVRPHIGLGIGYYRTKSALRSDDDMGPSIEVPLKRYEAIGFSPELGVNFGLFQLAFISDIIPGTVIDHNDESYLFNLSVRAIFNIDVQNKDGSKKR
ncbi:hypothetical protein [Flammeovirga sp. OC4]|uniref:hypothetical protein n=1 Tax=Flammeovirga sp. OC4 TaxID=1382345 RepID=UPI0005C749F3|nr:hypothetical protein [Flammeovirga sp. OC4]